MSKSKNRLIESDDVFIKEYSYKTPLFRYLLRSSLDFLGVKQPVEYYRCSKRISFEEDVLNLWKEYNLNVPEVIKSENKSLFMSKIHGKTLFELFKDGINFDILKLVFEDLNNRHTLSLKFKEPKLCHIDANLRNMIYSNNKIYHIDFEMGREYENVDKWIERELSKLLISLLSNRQRKDRDVILSLFVDTYSHKDFLYKMINKKLSGKKITDKKYTLKNVLFELNDIINSNKKVSIDENKIKSILFIYSGRFGDILLSTPSLRLVKERFPNSSITFLTHPSRLEVIKNNSLIDEIGFISKNKMSVKNSKYDLAIILNKEASFIEQALKVSNEVISFSSNDFDLNNKLLYTKRYPLQHSLHSVDMRLSLLDFLEKKPSSKRLIYEVSLEEKKFADAYLEKYKDKYLIGIQSNSFHTKSFRNWSIENFVSLCKKINEISDDVFFILLGSKDDIPSVKLINEEIPNSLLLAGTVSLRESAAIMNKFNLYVGVDTGPTHIVGTMDVPMIVMYHSFASSSLLKPLENDNFVALDHPDSNHGNDKSSMNDISVEMVFNEVIKKMEL